MEKKKILFITGTIFKAGAGKMLRHVASLMAREGHEVYAVSLGSEIIPETKDGVIYLEPLHICKSGVVSQIKTIHLIRKLIKNIRPDIVTPFVVNIVFCTRVATIGMRKIKIAGAERNDPYSYPTKWKVLGKWAFLHCDWCFFQLDYARDFYGSIVSSKSFVIPNAAFFEGEIGVHKEKNKTIVSAGRFRYEKGYDILIDAFKVIHKKHPDYKLIIYGEGPLLSKYERQVEKLGLKESVSFPGYTLNISKALEKESIFVLPSRAEGIPNVLVEALLIGIPTVSCDCMPGGPRFLTRDGKYGTIVPVNDVYALTEGILELIENKSLYKKYEEDGPKVYDVLNPEIIEEKWLHAYNKIIESIKN